MYNPTTWILFSDKKEWHTDTCYNLDESWKHYAKWKKLVAKDHIVSFIWNVQNWHTYGESGLVVVQGGGEGGNGEWLLMGMEFLFGVMQVF